MEKRKKTKAYAFGSFYVNTDTKEVGIELSFELTDFSAVQKITAETRGLSPEFYVRSFQCSVCSQNFETCDHTEGHEYEGKKCFPLMSDYDLVNVSVVSEPRNTKSLISDLVLIENIN